jgi:nitrate/nitrite transport system ATP-binding protein
VVENPLPKDRARIDLHRHPHYYALRNHIIDFLVSRSKNFAATGTVHDPRNVPVVRIGLSEPTLVTPAMVGGHNISGVASAVAR